MVAVSAERVSFIPCPVVEACVQVDAEGQGGGAMVTVSFRPYRKGCPSESPYTKSRPDEAVDQRRKSMLFPYTVRIVP